MSWFRSWLSRCRRNKEEPETTTTIERSEWDRPVEFILSLIGYAVGLGNIWRFPYIAMNNGGGAFLVPYASFMLFCGIPFCYLEFTLGQYSGLSPVEAFGFAPLFRGLGWAMLLVSGVLCIYYNIIMAWVVYYFFQSFNWNLPWKSCNNSWNTPTCFSYTGMVVYVTALLPYVFLTILVARGVTLPGASMGLQFYLRPDWSALKSQKIWTNAAVQVFYSLGPAWGGLITMSSYNRYHRKFNWDAVILPIVCGGTSIFGGFAVFSIVGHMAYQMGSTNVTALMNTGPGLAFIVYPEALAQIPGAPIWTVLFFAMLFTLGLDSQFATLETMTSGLIDRFPKVLGRHKTLFTLFVCVVQFGLGMILVTRAGGYYFQVFDWYATPTSVILIATLEVIAMSYVYGARKFFKHAETMIGQQNRFMRAFWLAVWYLITPCFTFYIFITVAMDYSPPVFNNGQAFPKWTVIFGWCIASISIIPIPLFATIEIYRNRHNLIQLFKPTPQWTEACQLRLMAAQTAKVEEGDKNSSGNEIVEMG